MKYKKLILLCISVVSILIYFAIPFYNDWLKVRILNTHLSIFFQAQNMDINIRREMRYGNPYLIAMQASKILEKANVQDPVILLPPSGFLKTQNIFDFDIDPPVFYYFTGIRSVYATSPGVEMATSALVPNNMHKIVLKKIYNKQDLDKIISIYKPYSPL